MDYERPPPARVPRQRNRATRRGPNPADDDRLVEAARHGRPHPADADPLVRLLEALRTAGEVRAGRER